MSPADVGAAPDADAPSGTLLAIRNAFKLGGSLIVTWGIGLGIRLVVPRYLGPVRFGTLNFADGFTAAAFIVLTLGADQYIRKEVAVRPSHASDFFGGVFSIRIVLALLVFAGMAAVMNATGRSSEVATLIFIYGAAQFFMMANATLSAMLHAKGHVGGMSVLAVATKIVWGVGLLAAMVTGAGLWAYGASYMASESIETFALYGLARKHLGLRFRIDGAATKAMLLASLPFYLQGFATTAYGKLDVSLLEFMGSSQEVGFYGAAGALSSLTLLLSPLIAWVLTPMLSRAATRSSSELFEQTRRSLELVMTVAIPVSMIINVGADFWIRLVFGEAFMPAVTALRIQASMFVLMYVSMIYWTVIVMLERTWAVTLMLFAGLVVNLGLNLAMIRPGMQHLGPGGGGTAAAIAMLGTESTIVLLMAGLVGRSAFDRRNVSTIAKSLLAFGVVGLLDRALRRIGPLRLVVDAAVYVAIVVATGALRVREITGVVRQAVANRSEQKRENRGDR